MMVVSILQIAMELDYVTSLKEKRSIVKSLKDRLQRRFHISVAEVDDNDSLGHAWIAAAVLSNSRSHGEAVLARVLAFAEENAEARISDVAVFSEVYD
jgi:uncharacterized protein